MTDTCFAPAANALRRLIELYGYDPKPYFKAQNISLRETRDPNARLRNSQFLGVWTSFAKDIDDPCFALRIGEVAHPSFIGAMGYAWLASSTLRTAFQRAVRFRRFIADDVEFRIKEEKKEFTIIRSHSRELPPDAYWDADAAMSMIVWLCRLNAGPDFNPSSVHLVHDAPPCSGDYFALFRCPVNFGAKSDRIALRARDVDRELDGANPNVALLHDQIMIKTIARLKHSRIVDRARAAIIEELPSGGVTDERIAAKLLMSTRSFQRRLGEEGTSFKVLMTDIRKELARKYIRNSALTLTEIAFQLGFSETSAFSNAYKRWTGHSPRADRKAA